MTSRTKKFMHKKSWHKDLMHEKFMFMHENEFSVHEKGGGQIFTIMYGNILFVYDDVIFMHENDIFMHGNSCPCMKFPCHDFCIQKTLRTGSA